jgi:alkylation response protein AidB-like acyl-CoA dehydrogenase
VSSMSLIDQARSLRSLIEDEADEAERICTMTAPVVDALTEAGLFSLLVPSDLGGHEADVATIVDVCEELSYADGSVGWAYAQNTTVGGYLAYIDPSEAQKFAGLRAGAGMFAPMGTAEVVDGGYRVSGDYRFGSGSRHAQFMGGSALIMRDGEVADAFASGAFPVVGFLIPAENVDFEDNWDTMGLRGTGSVDFSVPEQVVSETVTWPILEPGVSRWVTGGAIYGLGAVPLGTISSASWAIGVARRALAEIAGIATGGRARLGQNPLREQPTFQRDFGFHQTAVSAARLLVVDSYSSAVDAIAADQGDDACAALIRETKAAANHSVRTARDAVTFAWESSGSAGMRNPSRLQRCFRDIYMGAGHMVFDDRNYMELAKVSLDLETAAF